MKNRCRCGILRAVVTLCAWLAFCPVLQAVTVVPVNLEYMTKQADRIFFAKVLSVEDDFDETGLWSQFVTFDVLEIYKGEVGDSLTIKQVNLQPPPGTEGHGSLSLLAGVLPQYREGEEVVVFLSPDSEIGFTSTIGLMQGTFRVVSDESGEKFVVNKAQNAGLFKGLDVALSHQARGKAKGLSGERLKALQERPASLGLKNMKDLVKGFLINE